MAVAFTLVEALLAASLLAMSISAITMPFVSVARNNQEELRRTMAVTLAQEMLEEILSRPFQDTTGDETPGPEAGESRPFGNIGDYDGHEESAGNVCNAQGQVVTDEAALGLSRHVNADYVYLQGQEAGSSPTFICVIVEIRSGSMTLVRLTRLVYDVNNGEII